MKSVSESQIVSVRLHADLLQLLDAVATQRSCDRSDALRFVIQVGAPLINKALNVNIERLLTGLEILVIDCLRRAADGDPSDADVLVKAAESNVGTYHV